MSGCISDKKLTTTTLLETTTTLSELEKCANLTDEFDKPRCYRNLAINKKNELICDAIPEEFEEYKHRTKCYIGVAIATRDISICEKFTDDEKIVFCIHEVAIGTNNVSLCDIIPDEYTIKYHCYLSLRDTENKSIIDKIFFCKNDSDCVPSTFCHPTECINVKFRYVFEGQVCGSSCEPFTMDCCSYCGCKCINNTCIAILNNGTFT